MLFFAYRGSAFYISCENWKEEKNIMQVILLLWEVKKIYFTQVAER